MALIAVVAGRYSGTWAATSLGITSDDGYELSWVTHAEMINATDAFGNSMLEFLYRGADFKIRWTGLEYSTGSLRPAWPWGAGGPDGAGFRMATTALLGTASASALTLTATAGTPAATRPATLSAAFSVVSPNTQHSLRYTSKVRAVPVELVLFPEAVGGGVTAWFTTT